jgi:hypothetical protein
MLRLPQREISTELQSILHSDPIKFAIKKFYFISFGVTAVNAERLFHHLPAYRQMSKVLQAAAFTGVIRRKVLSVFTL